VNEIRQDKERLRELRREQTPAEAVLWELLRDRQLLGLKFRRQCPISRYVADFCCKDPRFVVEVDGEIHQSQLEHDRNRDAYLRFLEYGVVRFSNRQVVTTPDSVLAEIARFALSLRPSLALKRPARS
jgi:type I restriction enzyme R subunit